MTWHRQADKGCSLAARLAPRLARWLANLEKHGSLVTAQHSPTHLAVAAFIFNIVQPCHSGNRSRQVFVLSSDKVLLPCPQVIFTLKRQCSRTAGS